MKRWMLIFCVSALPSIAMAEAQGWLVGDVQEIYTTNSADFGGCMAKINPGPQSVAITGTESGLACGNNYVSFDCSAATGGTSKEGIAKFDGVKLAYVMGKRVALYLNADRTIGGKCVADIVRSF